MPKTSLTTLQRNSATLCSITAICSCSNISPKIRAARLSSPNSINILPTNTKCGRQGWTSIPMRCTIRRRHTRRRKGSSSASAMDANLKKPQCKCQTPRRPNTTADTSDGCRQSTSMWAQRHWTTYSTITRTQKYRAQSAAAILITSSK